MYNKTAEKDSHIGQHVLIFLFLCFHLH